MAEFVSKSIDNLSHGITVNKALEKLGLQESVSKFLQFFMRLDKST